MASLSVVAPARTLIARNPSVRSVKNGNALARAAPRVRTVRCSATPHQEGATSRRGALTASALALLIPQFSGDIQIALADGLEITAPPRTTPTKVFVAGATGQTGRRVVEQLRKQGIAVRAGVRDIKKAESLGLGLAGAELVKFDVTGTAAEIAEAIGDADAVVCATGFSPTASNWAGLKPGASLPVDKQGTINLVDAAKAANVKHFVLVSSLLTNGAACKQTDNGDYKVLQAFGGVLGSKREAEIYLQKSGLDYTVVRPGGLSNEPASTPILASGADTLPFGGNVDAGRAISRDQVAEVAVAALFEQDAVKKIVEIVGAQSGSGTPKSSWFAFPEAPTSGCATPV